MKSSFENLIIYIVLFLGIITSVVISGKQNKQGKNPDDLDLQPSHGSIEKEEITSEEEDLDKEIAGEHTQTCVELLVDCWLYFNRTKPYLKEKHRERICYKRIHGFPVCGAIDEKDVANAKQRAETHVQEELEKKLAYAERRRRLQEWREEWEEMRDSVYMFSVTTPSGFDQKTEYNSRELD